MQARSVSSRTDKTSFGIERVKRQCAWGLSGIVLLCGIWGCGRPAPQSSESAPSKALREDAAFYAERYRVSLDEAVRRLQVQSAVGELEDLLLREERASFAGMWIEHEPAFRVVVRSTDPAAMLRSFPDLGSTKGDVEVEVRPARYSLADLERDQTFASELATRNGAVVESDIDVRENRVELYVADEQTVDRVRSAVVPLSPSVVVIGVSRLAQLHALEGGEQLSTCTGGFTVGTPGGDLGITTAGHCQDMQMADGVTLNFRKEDRQGNQEVQWHSACGLLDVDNTFESGIGVREVLGTRHRDKQTKGSIVCKFGRTTGRTCGVIDSKNYKFPGASNPAPTFIRVEGGNTMLSDSGDCGGPWYVENVAYGINLGKPAAEDDNKDRHDAVYMAINYIDSIGVKVLTHDPPGPNCNICSVTLCGSGKPPCCAGACKPSGVGGLKTCQQ